MEMLQQQIIAQEWADHQDAAEAIGSLPDDARETTIDDFANLTGVKYLVARVRGQNLAKSGLVTYTKGSRGRQSRIRWNLTPRAVADVLLGKTNTSINLIGSSTESLGFKPSEYLGKSVWNLTELVSLISKCAGVQRDEVVIDLKIPEVKALLARSEGIPVDDVYVRMG